MSLPGVVVIIDNGRIGHWQLEALMGLSEIPVLLVLNCTNTKTRKRPVKHGLYYLLNLLSMKNSFTRKIRIAETPFRDVPMVDFASDYDGAWQRLPDATVAEINATAPLAVVKFGMSLLRIPRGLNAPILSYHHGDPEMYRGRPAGFYETLHGSGVMGQIVQILSDKLDAGSVVAFAETKVFPHSYRATMAEAYRHSKLLLPQAIRNLSAGERIGKDSKGPNYRLPSNWVVTKFALRLARSYLARLLYGVCMEKRWEVSTGAEPPAWHDLLASEETNDAFRPWSTVPRPQRFTFYADPFFTTDPPGLLVEAMNRRSGKGEIVLIPDEGEPAALFHPPGHFSYPGEVEEGGCFYVVPEIAQWSPPRIYRVCGNALEEVARLRIAGEVQVVDPTFLRHEGRLYMFGNAASVGSNALYLWSADGLFGEFRPHPLAPVLVSPKGGRMAGSILRSGGSLIRLGQDFVRGYGDGVFAFEIERLSEAEYRERRIGALRFSSVRGPHTLNVRAGRVVFDWYREAFAPLAGLRRFLGRRS